LSDFQLGGCHRNNKYLIKLNVPKFNVLRIAFVLVSVRLFIFTIIPIDCEETKGRNPHFKNVFLSDLGISSHLESTTNFEKIYPHYFPLSEQKLIFVIKS